MFVSQQYRIESPDIGSKHLRAEIRSGVYHDIKRIARCFAVAVPNVPAIPDVPDVHDVLNIPVIPDVADNTGIAPDVRAIPDVLDVPDNAGIVPAIPCVPAHLHQRRGTQPFIARIGRTAHLAPARYHRHTL
jgi:hypothetical protein